MLMLAALITIILALEDSEPKRGERNSILRELPGLAKVDPLAHGFRLCCSGN